MSVDGTHIGKQYVRRGIHSLAQDCRIIQHFAQIQIQSILILCQFASQRSELNIRLLCKITCDLSGGFCASTEFGKSTFHCAPGIGKQLQCLLPVRRRFFNICDRICHVDGGFLQSRGSIIEILRGGLKLRPCLLCFAQIEAGKQLRKQTDDAGQC